jgi:hypothetical protein
MIKENRLYDSGVSFSEEDSFVILSTCSYHDDDGRFIVAARRIS